MGIVMAAEGLPGVAGKLVIELGEGIAAPFCGMHLAELGARVIKIEPPGGDWSRGTGPPFVGGESAVFLALNRNKESVVLDLKKPESLQAARSLIARADVVIQAYRPGVAERLGLGPDLTNEFSRLVYCTLSGYGDRGPKRTMPATDTIIQGYAGIMSVTGHESSGPARVGTSLADTSAGVYATLGVVGMLLRREITGRGGIVSGSLVESLLSLQVTGLAMSIPGVPQKLLGSRSTLAAVPAEAFETADSRLMLSCHGDRQWRKLCETLEMPQWLEDSRMRTNEDRVENHDVVAAAIGDVLKTRTTRAWMDLFESRGVNAGEIQTYEELFHDPQIAALGILAEENSERYGSYKYVLPGILFEGVEWPSPHDPPRLGEQTESVLTEFGI
jgi:CoA:oxalate CoA-transferase